MPPDCRLFSPREGGTVQRKFRLAGIVLITTLIAPAYLSAAEKKGKQPAPAPAAGASEACSLLTKEDAAAALGEAVTAPRLNSTSKGDPGMSVSSCEYAGAPLHRIRLIVTHFPAAQADIYKGFCAQKGHEGITGLGDVACWYNDKHEELQVLKGNTLLSIVIRGKPNPNEAVKAAMKKVYGRLK
jgi:hypothetical protein